MKDYPVITIRDASNGVSQTRPARQVTKHLAVGTSNPRWDTSTFKVFSIQGQRPAIPHRISTYLDAIEIALLLEKVYGEYWAIHEAEDWKHIDIPMVSRLSVPDGEQLYNAITNLSDLEIITYNKLQMEINDEKKIRR